MRWLLRLLQVKPIVQYAELYRFLLKKMTSKRFSSCSLLSEDHIHYDKMVPHQIRKIGF